MAFDKQGKIWYLERDGDRFMARRPRRDETVPPRNFERAARYLWVDGVRLSYDLTGKRKEVLAWHGPAEETQEDNQWEAGPGYLVTGPRGGKSDVVSFRAKSGALKGWWIGLGPAEPRGDERPRRRLVLVPDKKDALGFDWTNPDDEEGP